MRKSLCSSKCIVRLPAITATSIRPSAGMMTSQLRATASSARAAPQDDVVGSILSSSFEGMRTEMKERDPVVVPTNAKRATLAAHAIKSAHCHNTSVTVEWGDGTKADFHNFWLRDNCRCPECFHPVSFQRQVDTLQILPALQVERVEVLENAQLSVTWKHDGISKPGHKTVFSGSWLKSCLNNDLEKCTRKYNRVLWDANTVKKQLPAVEFGELEGKGDAGLLKWINLIHCFGFALVRNVPNTPEETRRLIEKISHTQNSMFGDFWDFTVYDQTNSLSHGDTAYTNVCLSPHTDGTYFREPPGLQFFRIVSHTGKGGETQLVDGFNIAERMKKNHNDVYKYLCETPIHFNYKDSKNSIVSAEKIFQFDEDGVIKQVRFNNDDRSPFYLPPSQVDRFYDAIRLILKEIKDPENVLQFSLTPGDVLVTNNWRVLHGRTEFTGDRRLSGAYMGMQDFISKTRVLDRNLNGNHIV